MRTHFLLVLGLCLFIDARATEQSPPTRPLREGDQLALRVGEASLVVVGHVVSAFDTTTSVRVGGIDMLRHVLVVTFEPQRVLKGQKQPRTMRYVNWLSSSRSLSADERAGDRGPTYNHRGSAPMILFLDDLVEFAAEGVRMPEQRISRWATRDLMIGNWTETFEQQVRDEIGRQRPEAMAAHADRIVLAHPSDEHFIDPQPWIVERSIRGDATERVKVRLVAPESHRTGTNLLLLRKVGSVYEPVRLAGGAVPVRKGRVPRWNCSLDEAIARITR